MTEICKRYMSSSQRRNDPIQLDPDLAHKYGREETEKSLRRIVRSVKFELLENSAAFRLLGPEMSYHEADPHLPAVLRVFNSCLTVADILRYTSSTRHFDLCFEDSWTGYFIAKRCKTWSQPEDLIFIHLDDHTDMMSTLLCCSRDTLFDPTTSRMFDPTSSGDWEMAIHSGTVNIGNFITPFYYSQRILHVRHINNSAESGDLCYVSRETCEYELIPGKQFAGISLSAAKGPQSGSTYQSGPDPARVLDGIPGGWIIVHIDLDYFINDFNGASRGPDYIPNEAVRTRACEKIKHFFGALNGLKGRVDRWIIATSPGFCSAFHWEWLLTELKKEIELFRS